MVSPKGEIDQRPRRFYTDVSIAPEPGAQQPGGWGVKLDGRPLRTSEKLALVAPTERLAAVIADEWRAQGERIDLLSMYNTRLANVVLDRAPHTRAELAAEVARYTQTDLVCHLAERPAALRSRQDTGWGPLRAWAEKELGVRLVAIEGLMPATQPRESTEAARAHAASLDNWRLTALVHAIAMLGSAILGLAVERRRLTALDAFDLSRIDETFQAEQWGEDAEAARFTARTREEAHALDRWFEALKA